jgi:hypothetical protein
MKTAAVRVCDFVSRASPEAEVSPAQKMGADCQVLTERTHTLPMPAHLGEVARHRLRASALCLGNSALAAAHLLPIAALVAGVFLLVAPRIVSFAVAVYLIFVGLLGLNRIYHLFK